jgi:hypothetical protein
MKYIVAQEESQVWHVQRLKPPAKYRHIQTRIAAHAVLLIIVMFIAGLLTSMFLGF